MDLDDLTPLDLSSLDERSERGQLRLPGIDEVYRNVAPIAMCPPIVKYAGGKGWIVPLVVPRIHLLLAGLDGATYVEPFAGGLAVGLALGWPRAIYADSNPDLMNLYAAIAIDPAQVADELDAIVARGWDEPTYYEVRRSIWPENRPAISQFGWAARVLYLNKTAFNGLWRANKRGQFNVPCGRYAQPAFPSREAIARTAAILAPADLRCADFGEVLAHVLENEPQRAVVYLDPPYGEVLDGLTAAGRIRGRDAPSPLFVGYTSASFTWADQVRLAEIAAALRDAGAVVVATNTWSDAVRDLWSGFDHFQCRVRHSVGATADRRGDRVELIAISPAHAGLLEQSNVRRLGRRR